VSRYIPQQVKIRVAVRDQGKCRNCGKKNNLEYHHVIPWHVSKSHALGNIILLCSRCHRIVHGYRKAALLFLFLLFLIFPSSSPCTWGRR